MEKNKQIIICRCMEISEDEIMTAVKKGATTVDAVKRATKAGMGLCQSKTCHTMTTKIIHDITGVPISELTPMRIRIPVRPIRIDSLYKKN